MATEETLTGALKVEMKVGGLGRMESVDEDEEKDEKEEGKDEEEEKKDEEDE